jgi:lipopolysaccharide export system protein LptC
MFTGGSRRSIGWILAVAAAGAIACAPARSPESAGDPPELRLEGVRYRLYRGEAVRADGTAATVSFRRDSTDVKGTDLTALLHDRAEPVRMTAPAGNGVVQTRRFEASGGIRAVRKMDVVTTATARFVPVEGPGAGGIVVGDEPVQIEGTGYRMQGTGFTLDPAAGDVVLRGQPRLLAGLPVTGGAGKP